MSDKTLLKQAALPPDAVAAAGCAAADDAIEEAADPAEDIAEDAEETTEEAEEATSEVVELPHAVTLSAKTAAAHAVTIVFSREAMVIPFLQLFAES